MATRTHGSRGTGAMHKLLVFAAAPQSEETAVSGIPAPGEAGAVRTREKMIRHTLQTADAWRQAGGGVVELWCAPDPQNAFFAACAAEFGVVLKAQFDGDPGARLWLALCGTLAGGAVPLLIGTDCPWITIDHLDRAQQALQQADAVFAPADYGGYVLAGLRRAVPELFAAINWGGGQVMAQTRMRAHQLGPAQSRPAPGAPGAGQRSGALSGARFRETAAAASAAPPARRPRAATGRACRRAAGRRGRQSPGPGPSRRARRLRCRRRCRARHRAG
jgi:uncharacterized protein